MTTQEIRGFEPYQTSDGSRSVSEQEVRSRSVGELVGDISKDLSTLIHQEIELAKAETKQEVTKAAKGAGMLGGAGFAGYMVALFGTLTLAYVIGTFWPAWTGALIATALWAVVGAVLYTRGRKQMATVTGPRNTVETLKEDAAWARHPTS
jgi:hypothetical protein